MFSWASSLSTFFTKRDPREECRQRSKRTMNGFGGAVAAAFAASKRTSNTRRKSRDQAPESARGKDVGGGQSHRSEKTECLARGEKETEERTGAERTETPSLTRALPGDIFLQIAIFLIGKDFDRFSETCTFASKLRKRGDVTAAFRRLAMEVNVLVRRGLVLPTAHQGFHRCFYEEWT